MKKYVLYNSISGDGVGEVAARGLALAYPNDELVFADVTKLDDYTAFIKGVESDAAIIVCGGDGTLNNFINNANGLNLTQNVYYLPCGNGNDFARDMEKHDSKEPFLINDCIKDLPTVEVNGMKRVFINGVGYGIDGYCCEQGDIIKKKGKKPNYTSIAITGLLFFFKRRNATVIVDGNEYSFKNVWIAPTMIGRCYGGGMYPTPNQDRFAENKELSLMLFHGWSRLKVLMVFPSIFKGEHVKHEKQVTILTGKRVTVKFDKPSPLQIDGETVLNVNEYTAYIN